MYAIPLMCSLVAVASENFHYELFTGKNFHYELFTGMQFPVSFNGVVCVFAVLHISSEFLPLFGREY